MKRWPQNTGKMGLDDIDDDVPLTHAPQASSSNGLAKRPVQDLDDLFGGLGVAQHTRHPPTAPQQSAGVPPVASSSKPQDFLDSLFTSQPVTTSGSTSATVTPTAAPQSMDNLFTFTAVTEKKHHTTATGLLDAFVNQSKGIPAQRDQVTLGEVKSLPTSKVAANLLSLMNYYDVLGVDESADVDEIKRKYKKKALELHPDKVGVAQTPEEQALFKTITKAHEILTDPFLRLAYDAELKKQRAKGGQESWLQHLDSQ